MAHAAALARDTDSTNRQDEKEMTMRKTRDVTIALFLSALIVFAAGQVMAQAQDCPGGILQQTANCTVPPGTTHGCEIWEIINNDQNYKIVYSSHTDHSFTALIQWTDASGDTQECSQTETYNFGEGMRITGTDIETDTRIRVKHTIPASEGSPSLL